MYEICISILHQLHKMSSSLKMLATVKLNDEKRTSWHTYKSRMDFNPRKVSLVIQVSRFPLKRLLEEVKVPCLKQFKNMLSVCCSVCLLTFCEQQMFVKVSHSHKQRKKLCLHAPKCHQCDVT